MTAPESHSVSNPYHVEVVRDFKIGYSRAVRASVVDALDCGRRSVIVDCAGWDHLDFSVLSALIQCASACRLRGASFKLVNLSHSMHSSIEALRLDGRLGLDD
jgi:anti-anti-sigma regulatory factor